MNMTRGTPASSQIIWLEKRVDELLTENTRLVEENRTLTNAIRILDQRQVILDKALRNIKDHPHKDWEHPDLLRFTDEYRDGIAKGHKVCAEIANEALEAV